DCGGGGTAIHQQSGLVTPDASGDFSINVGPFDSALLSTAQPLFLQATVNVFPLLPRKPLVIGQDVAAGGSFRLESVATPSAYGLLSQSNLRLNHPIGSTLPNQQFAIVGGANEDVFAGMGVDLSAGPAFNF